MKLWRPYTQMLGAKERERAARADGAHIVLEDGRRIFDGISSWWLITHGHCHPEISAAVARQSERLDQVVFADFDHEPARLVLAQLEALLPKELGAAFFSDNGSTAVEVAMKMAYQYVQAQGMHEKTKFCAFANSYHGDTFGAMSVTADGAFTNAYKDLRIEVLRCEQGRYLSDDLNVWLGDFERKLRAHHHEIIAVLIEPLIQGAAGMIVWPREAVRRLCRLCRELGVLVIFDEVMTGFGRTGTMFAFEQTGEVPDMVCLSKGLTGGTLPLALTLTTDEIFEAFLSQDTGRMLFHGHSFTGNAISCAAASANLKLFQDPAVLARVEQMASAHRKAVARIGQEFELRDSRVLGAIGVIELKQDASYGADSSRRLAQRCLEQGLFLRPLGNVIYLMPPYCAKPEEIEWAWEVVAKSLSGAITS
jgi:adenosylmethionine-8-amino-7-oxononanoate aminotransferase